VAKRITLTRQELYEKVWTTPLSKMSKELGMSDVGLGKLCNRLRIPKPGLGYWTKIAHGQKIGPPSLPPESDERPESIVFAIKEEVVSSIPTEIAEFKSAELSRIQQIKLPAIKTDIRTIKQPTLVELRKAQPRSFPPWKGWVSTGSYHYPRINVPEQSWKRALLFLEVLFSSAESCGYRLKTNDNGQTHLQVFEAEIRLSLREKAKQVKNIPLTSNKEDYTSRYESKVTYLPTGIMCLTMVDSRYGILEHMWCDSGERKLEDLLPEFLVGLVDIGAGKRMIRTEEQGSELRSIAFAKKQEEQEKKLRAEKTLQAKLWDEAESWSKANRLRAYIEAKKHLEFEKTQSSTSSEDFRAWLDWAGKEADRIDPLHADDSPNTVSESPKPSS
jgi:hypothetical protein